MSFYYCVIMTVLEALLTVCNDSGKHKLIILSLSVSLYVCVCVIRFDDL